MRYSYAAVGALMLCLWTEPAYAVRYTDVSTVKSLTVLKDGSLRLTLKYQDCPAPISIGVFYASRSFSLLLQALLHSRKVRVTSDTSGTFCNVAAVELL